MVDSVSYLPTELTGAALQMGQYYQLHHIKPSSAYSPDVLCSQKYSLPTVSTRELVLVCSPCSFCSHRLFRGYSPQPREHGHLSKSHCPRLMQGLWALGRAMLGVAERSQQVPRGLSSLCQLRLM